MPPKKREIFAMVFNKVHVQNDVLVSRYELGKIFLGMGVANGKTPLKIEIIKKASRVLTTFSDGTSHEIKNDPDIEFFWRDVETKTKK